MKHKCPNCKKVKNEFKQFRKFHNEIMNVTEIAFKMSGKDFKQIIKCKDTLMTDLLNYDLKNKNQEEYKLDKQVIRSFNLNNVSLGQKVKKYLKNNLISRLIIKHHRLLKIIFVIFTSLNLIQGIFNKIMNGEFSFNLLIVIFNFFLSIFT